MDNIIELIDEIHFLTYRKYDAIVNNTLTLAYSKILKKWGAYSENFYYMRFNTLGEAISFFKISEEDAIILKLKYEK